MTNAYSKDREPHLATANRKNNAPALRKRLLAARDALSVTQRQQASEAIADKLRASMTDGLIQQAVARLPHRPIVAAFWPIRSEPDLRPLLTAWAGQCCDIALPRIVQRDAPLEFHRWQPGAPMLSGHFGVQEPATSALCTPDILLVPTLGYDEQAARLGYGGGYYDRTLAQFEATGHRYLAIGIAYALGRLTADEHQVQEHDMPLDAVVTEEGWTVAGTGRQDDQ